MPAELLMALLLAAQTTPAAPAQPAETEDLGPLVRKAMLTTLKDPMSAQYIELRRAKNPDYLCGQVNSKNSYGAYTGFRPFVVTPTGVQIADDDPIVGPHAARFIALVCTSSRP